MKRTLKNARTAVAILISGALSACVGVGSTGMSIPRLSEQTNIPEVTLKSGRAYHLRECNTCHQLIQPGERKPAEWEKILAGKRTKVSLTPVQFEKLKLYIMASSEVAEQTQTE